MKRYIGFHYDRQTGEGSLMHKRSPDDAGVPMGSCLIDMDAGEPKGVYREGEAIWLIGERDVIEFGDEGE